jgi:hypothetical protein
MGEYTEEVQNRTEPGSWGLGEMRAAHDARVGGSRSHE